MKSVNVAITGPSSMVGQHLQAKLPEFHHRLNIHAGHHYAYDFTKPESANAFIKQLPDESVIYHLAGYNGNIQFNKDNPSDIYYNTVMMGLNLLRATETHFLKKGRPVTFVNILTSCAYPDVSYLKPEEFFNGKPHDSVECHGFAKRTLFEFSRQLAKKYWACERFNTKETTILNIVPSTLFGPFDSVDPAKTKVIGSMLYKFMEAKKTGGPVKLFGTGGSYREFMYVEDFVENLIKFVGHAGRMQTSPSEVYNFGAYNHIRIFDLALLICKILNYDPAGIIWDISKPDGQHCKKLLFEETLTLFKEGGLRYIDNGLENGLRQTVAYLLQKGC